MALPDNHITEADYLAFERNSDTKHEYANGKIYAMTGASWQHNVICANVVTALNMQLAKSPCVVVNDMRVQVAAAKSYRYPDVAVVCDPPQFADERTDTITNPALLIEVLSPSTALVDRNEKLREYRQLASLQAYLLIARDEPRIERFLRQDAQNWLYADVTGLDARLALPAPLNGALALADVYRKITFDGDETQTT